MGEQRMYELTREFGFGQRTGIPLPGEARGITHSPDRWDKLTITRIPMGHAIATTPLQMAMAMSTIANRGQLMHPMLVDRLEDELGEVVTQYYPQKIRDVISPGAAADMVTALKSAASTNGTGRMAMLEHYTVAGKTGTAQKAGLGGYLPGKYYSSFIGFFPADNPELCIAVTIDEPRNGYYGGSTVAPTFKRIAEEAAVYLKIPPDKGLEVGSESRVANGTASSGSAELARSH
jgi:cell division protein FtsI/penicillin-binding protein 2